MPMKKLLLEVAMLFVCGVLCAQDLELLTASTQVEFPFLGGDQVIRCIGGRMRRG